MKQYTARQIPTNVCSRLILVVMIGLVSISAWARDFRLGLITPPPHTWTQAANRLAAELEEQSGGKHRLLVYPSRQLGNEAQMLRLMQTGALDMAILTAAEVSNRVPEFGALYTPYLAQDIEQAATILRGGVAAGLLGLLPNEIGVIGLGYGMAGMRQILSNVPVSSLADIQGKKLRITPFAPIRDFYTLAGAAPTPMPLSSVYDAMANGQIDMIDMDLELILKLRYYELSDTLVLSNHMMFPCIALFSGRVWIRLSEEDRQLISVLTRKHMEWIMAGAISGEAGWLAEARKLDIRLLEIDADFFEDAGERWEAIWESRSGTVSRLKTELARNQPESHE